MFFRLTILIPLVAAVPFPAITNLSGRQCIEPASFEIHGFQYFTPADSNPNNQSLSFTFVDAGTSISTSCAKTAAHGDPLKDESITYCTNSDVSFTWNTDLTVRESSVCLDSIYSGGLGISTFCYPVVSPYPLGDGTLCETPTGAVSGEYTSSVPN